MRIAIVGTGIAGLTAAWQLHGHHELTIFESESRLGGHTHTIEVEDAEGTHRIDTGFIVFNEPNYPGLNQLFRTLGVKWRECEMSFSVRNDAAAIEFAGSSIASLFARKRNLLRPAYWHFLREIARFNRLGNATAANPRASQALEDWLREHGFGPLFVENYLAPLGAAIWSAPPDRFLGFPLAFVLRFLHHHRMMSIQGRPIWRTVEGGSDRYLAPLTQPFATRVRLDCPVHRVARKNNGIELRSEHGTDTFDEVILACHSDQALALLEEPSPREATILGSTRYQTNEVVVHTDSSVLPRRRRAWASWNYRVSSDPAHPAMVTYDMNQLQGLHCSNRYLVSLNHGPDAIDASRVVRRLQYHHPQFSPQSKTNEACHPKLIRHEGISYCGAYWGNGFHEDGVQSALRVAAAYGRQPA